MVREISYHDSWAPLQELITWGFESWIDNTGKSYEWTILSIETLNRTRYNIPEETNLSGFLVVLARNPSPFYINTYLPTGLLTIISFIGFVIPVDLVPGRMALLVTIFLMLVNISSTEKSRGPIVSAYNEQLNS